MKPRLAGLICGAAALCIMPAAARAETGIASVYAYGGSRTASGERANPSALTAAHRTLPFGSHVRITNKRNGKSVVVRINDRGPFLRGRVIDVTPAAARALGFSGLARVSLERVSKIAAHSDSGAKPPERKHGESAARTATPTPLPPQRNVTPAVASDAPPAVDFAESTNAASAADVESTGSIIKAAGFHPTLAVPNHASADAENPASRGVKAALSRFWSWITGP